MKVGGEPLQQEFNRSYDFILNTYGSAENIIPGKNDQQLIQRGIVIEIDFDIGKNYRLAAAAPPFSIYAKIIGEDLDVDDPTLETQKIFYSPLLPIHNLCIPEIGEEILIIREGTLPSTQGYYIGRLVNTSALNYFPARQYMDSQESGETGPEWKYGFTFDVKELRRRKLSETPSNEIKCISIPVTYGDVVQQGRSQSYIRHSFNKNNKKGVLEQGLRFQQQNISKPLNNDMLLLNKQASSFDPSIGETATKNIHFVDTSIKRLGNYQLSTILPDYPEQNDINNVEDKSIIANLSDEIYNISTRNISPTLYRQVLGEKLVSHQKQTNNLVSNMLDGLTGLAETVQMFLNAFIEHEHAVPKIDLNTNDSIFTAPIQTDSNVATVDPLPGAPPQNITKTELGVKTEKINTDTEDLIDKFNNQKVQLNKIFNNATDFLSRNQFIN